MVARNSMACDPPVQHPEGCHVPVRLPFERFGFIVSVYDQLRSVGNSRMIDGTLAECFRLIQVKQVIVGRREQWLQVKDARNQMV